MAAPEKTKTLRFLSIKWRALFLTSSLLMVIFSLFYFSSRHIYQQQLESSAQRRVERYNDQFTTLLQQQAERVLGFATLLPKLEGMERAILSGDTDAIENALLGHWQSTEKNSAITSITLFSPSNEVLLWFNEPRIPAQLLTDFTRDWQATSLVSCYDVCEMYVAYPLNIEQWGRGILVIGASLNRVVKQLHEISKAAVAIGVHREIPSDSDALYFAGLSSELTDRDGADFDWQLLRSLATGVELRSSSTRYLVVDKQRIFEVARSAMDAVQYPRAGDVFWATDITAEYRQHKLALKNGLIFALVGLGISEFVLFLSLSGPMNRLRMMASILPLLATQKFSYVRERLQAANKPQVMIDETVVLNNAAIELSYLLEGMQEDILRNAQKLEQKSSELSREKNFVQSILDTAHVLILTQDNNGNITMCNQYCTLLTGYSSDELMGASFHGLLAESSVESKIKLQLNELNTGLRQALHHEALIVKKDKTSAYLAWHHTVLPEAQNHHKVLTIALDITERKQAEDRLGWLASHDPLTGLFNRRRFAEDLQQSIDHAKRYDRSGAIMFFDLDQFKDVNDSSGHQVGDFLLKRVAECLTKVARSTDRIFRLGGDEFALLAHEIDPLQIGLIADRFCRAINTVEISGGSGTHRVSTSVGIAIFPEHGCFADELIANADIAMYRAKSLGRNGWHLYSPEAMDRQRTQERVFWNEKVKEALATDSLQIAFQPIQCVVSKDISHFEALLRVTDEQGEVLPTHKFIHSAEQSGLIQEIDLRIVEKVLAYKQRLERKKINVSFAINLSGASFKNPNLPEKIAEKLKCFQVDPSQIVFEITETSAVEDTLSTADKMRQIKALGCKFALDDFGVGFSSLYHIKQLPLDLVKIDGSFVRNLPEIQEDQVLVKAVVEVAKVFGLKTVAEFVENENIFHMLKALGVDYAQGYYISKPQSYESLWPDVENDAI